MDLDALGEKESYYAIITTPQCSATKRKFEEDFEADEEHVAKSARKEPATDPSDPIDFRYTEAAFIPTPLTPCMSDQGDEDPFNFVFDDDGGVSTASSMNTEPMNKPTTTTT